MSTHRLSQKAREELALTLTLDDDLTEEQINALMTELKSQPYARSTYFISREQVLEEETKHLDNNLTDILAGDNPYTDIIELNVAAQWACTDSLKAIQQHLEQRWEIAVVDYPQELVERMVPRLHRATWAMIVLTCVLVFICMVLIANAIMRAIYARRFTIHTMRLVGASWIFVCRPFLLRSTLVGLISAALACVLLWGGIMWERSFDQHVATLISKDVCITAALAVTGTSLILNVICTLVAVNRYMSMREEKMY